MVFQHFEPKSSKNQRFFNSFRVGAGPGPAQARDGPGGAEAGTKSFKNQGFQGVSASSALPEAGVGGRVGNAIEGFR